MRIEPSFRPSADPRARAPIGHAPNGHVPDGLFDRAVDLLVAAVLATAAALLALCLLSWTASDHSFATRSLDPPRNWLGTNGALVADALMRSLGLAAVLLVLPLMIWAGDALSGRGIGGLKVRAIAAPVAVLCFAGLASSLPLFGSWPLQDGLGGYLGDQLTGLLVSTLVPAVGTWSGAVAALLFLAAGNVALLLALGRTPADIAAIVRTPVRLHLPDSSWVGRHLTRVATAPAMPAPAPASEPVIGPAAAPVAPATEIAPSQPVEPAPAVSRPMTVDTTVAASAASAPARVAWPQPPVHLLPRAPVTTTPVAALHAMDRLRAEQLAAALMTFSVRADVTVAVSGPRVTTFDVTPATGTKPARLLGLADDLARTLGVHGLRCIAVPGRATIAVEIPQAEPTAMALGDLVQSPAYRDCAGALPWAIGATVRGEAAIVDFASLGPVLLAGGDPEQRAGLLRGAVASWLYRSTPAQLRLAIVDGPGVPLSALNGLPHLDLPIATSPLAAVGILNHVAAAIEARRMAPGALPPLMLVVADLAAIADVPNLQAHLAAMASDGAACGVHVLAATSQLDNGIDALLPLFVTRLVGQTPTKADSRLALGATGAEDLLDGSDMLAYSRSEQLKRVLGGGVMPRLHPVGLEAQTTARLVDAMCRPLPQRAQAAPVATAAQQPMLVSSATTGANSFAHRVPRASTVPQAIYDRALPLVMRHAAIDADLLTVQLGIAYPQALDVLVQLQADRLVTAPDADGVCRVVVGSRMLQAV